MKRKKKKGEKREAVISVGRADCIRSNIMQAHTGSLLECVRSLGSSPLSSPPHGRFAYTQNIRYSRYERTVLFVEIQYVCGFTLLSRRSRARESSLPTYMRARECTCVYVCIYIYIYIYIYDSPYLHRNRGSIEPRKWP